MSQLTLSLTIENIQIWLLSLFCFLAGIIFSIVLVAADIIMVNYRKENYAKNKNLRDEISRIRNSKLAGNRQRFKFSGKQLILMPVTVYDKYPADIILFIYIRCLSAFAVLLLNISEDAVYSLKGNFSKI